MIPLKRTFVFQLSGRRDHKLGAAKLSEAKAYFLGNRALGRKLRVALLIVTFSVNAAGCSSLMPREPFTAKEQAIAEIPGMPSIRVWADAPVRELLRISQRPGERTYSYRGERDVLSISGGGADGAFSAGILVGWSRSGARSHPAIVTGASAGALVAPFAFLGPDRDAALTAALTGEKAAELNADGLFGILGAQDSRRSVLYELVSDFVDARMVQDIAAEHRKGRRLLVVTTNVDAQRAVIWDIGAIADSGRPEVLELIRKVLTASASIPGLFTPTLITVKAGNRQFEEMHADAGLITQVLTVPDALLSAGVPAAAAGVAPRRLFVIVNHRLEPEFSVTTASTLPLVSRSLASVIKSHTRSTLVATQEFARGNGIDFNVTFIGSDFKPGMNTDFSTPYRRAVFKYGYEKALSSSFWKKSIDERSARHSAAAR